MAYRELEVTLLSAQDLKSVNLITRMNVYAVVSISGDPLTRQCTAPDVYGGRNPCWNATFRFAVPPTSAAAAGKSLHVLLRAERFLGDRDVGEVVVPLAEILASATDVGPQPPKVASYQVRKLHRWEPRGVLNVSYRLGPVVAPVVERLQVGVPQKPSYPRPPAVADPAPPPAPAPGPPAVRVIVDHPPAKPDACRPPSPSQPPPQSQSMFVSMDMSVSVISPRSRNEDRWRPSMFSQSQSQHDTQHQQQAARSPVAASPFSSRSSSFSSPLSSSSAHSSSTRSPYSYSAHPSTATSPKPPAAASDATKITHGTTNNTFRSTSRGGAISWPSPSSSPMVPNRSRGSAISSPLPSSSPRYGT